MKILIALIVLSASICHGQTVARFAEFGASVSIPAANKRVRIMAGNRVYSGKTNSQGWLNMTVPCGKASQLIFGPSFANVLDVSIPCGRSKRNLGLFEWRRGEFISTDMIHVDGCRVCKP